MVHYSRRGTLAEDFGDQVKAIPDCRGVCLYRIAVDDFRDDIRPQALGLIQGMGHGRDPFRRGGLKLIDEIDNAGKFVYDVVEFTLLELEASE
jgi:hypothetical protein